MNKVNDPFRGRLHYELLLNFLSTLKGNFKLLEIGAQDEVIRKHIPKNISYSSLDMYGNPDYKMDLNEEKIPVKDNTFDILLTLVIF